MVNNLFGDLEEENARVDLTPLIDMMFLLLIFVLVATTFMAPGLNVDLPSANSPAAPEPGVRWLVISIDERGDSFAEGKKILPEDIGRLLEADPGKRINFHVDKKAPFQAFVGVVDSVRMKGVRDFIITTKAAENED